MEDQDLIALFGILKNQGVFNTQEEMQSVIDSEGVEVLYSVLPKGMFNTQEEFAETFSQVKKKDESVSIVQEDVTESITPDAQEEVISSDASAQRSDSIIENDYLIGLSDGSIKTNEGTVATISEVISAAEEQGYSQEEIDSMMIASSSNPLSVEETEASVQAEMSDNNLIPPESVPTYMGTAPTWEGIQEEAEAESLPTPTSKSLDEMQKYFEQNIQDLKTEKEVDLTIKTFNEQTKAFNKDIKSFIVEKTAFINSPLNKYFTGGVTKEDLQNLEVKAAYDDWKSQQQTLITKQEEFKSKDAAYATRGLVLDRAVGEYTELKSEEGNWAGAFLNSFLTGVGRVGSGVVSLVTDVMVEAMPLTTQMGEENYAKAFVEKAKQLGIDLPEDKETILKIIKKDDSSNVIEGEVESTSIMNEFNNWKDSIEGGIVKSIDSAIRDDNKKITKFEEVSNFRNQYSSEAAAFDAGMGLVDAVRVGAKDYLGHGGTSDEYSNLKKEGFWGGALLGVTESIPAMIGGTGPVGFAVRTAQMYAQVSDHLAEEMRDNPEFDNITENEKLAITAPIGIAVAVLESVGFRNVMASKGLLNGVVARALGKSTSKTSAKSFSEFIKQDVKSQIQKGLLVVGAGGAAEFETGLAQEFADISGKQIYNEIKNKKMFSTPQGVGEYLSQVLKAGAQEAVGGFVLGAPKGVAVAMSSGKPQEVSDEMFQMFQMMSRDSKYTEMYESKLNERVSKGEITQSEADSELAMFNQLSGLESQIPSDYTTSRQKEALSILLQKQELEQKIARKNDILVKNEKKKIAELDAKLETLVDENAVELLEEKESAEAVPALEEDIATEEEVSTEEELDEVADFFGEQTSEDGTPTTTNNINVNKKGIQEDLGSESRRGRDKIINIASKAAKSIAKVLNTKILLHESKDEYNKYTGKTGRGFYNPTTDTIHINLTNATASTVAHEVFHAVLLSKVKTDSVAAKMTMDMVSSIRKALPKGSKLAARIDAFSELYKDTGFENEEKLAELMGILSSEYKQLDKPAKNVVVKFIEDIARKFGIKIPESLTKTDEGVIDLLNTMSRKVAEGEVIEEGDLKPLEDQEQGDSGDVGTIRIPRERIDVTDTVNAKDDSRPWIRDLVDNVEVSTLNGENFITNMYDYTNAGKTDLGNGYSLDLLGGRNYVPFIMSKTGKKLGDVSHLAAFNTKQQAEGFIRNAENGEASLFAPHSGTLDGSWQFQQDIFAKLVDLVLDKNILSKAQLIKVFNLALKSKKAKKSLSKFNKKNNSKLKNLNSFTSNPKELVRLLDIENNYSPDLRKILNQKIASDKTFQKAIGVKNLEEFHQRIMDPLNKGVVGNELMTFIKFDPTTFEIIKTDPKSIEHHPSFGWVVKAKIEKIFQPTKFYKSFDLTETYTKYNLKETVVSKKTDKGFEESNVTSSAGAIPKKATVKTPKGREQMAYRAGDLITKPEQIGKFEGGNRGTGHFGTGFYFLGKKEDAVDMAKLNNRVISELDLSDYNLAEGTLKLHDELKYINNKTIKAGKIVEDITKSDIKYIARIVGVEVVGSEPNPYQKFGFRNNKQADALEAEVGKEVVEKGVRDYRNFQYKQDKKINEFLSDINAKLKSKDNIDSPSTLVMKALGFEGVDSRGTELDTGVYGTVVYDIKTPEGREQKEFNEQEFIKEARDADFTDERIKDYLVRRKGMKVKNVRELLDINIDLLDKLPKSFGNIKGGVKAGLRLFNKVQAFRDKLIVKNNKLKKNKLSQGEIMDKTIEFLEAQPEYKAESETYKVKGETKSRKGLSTLQAQIITEFQKMNILRPTQGMRAKLETAKRTIKERGKGARDLKAIQRILKSFIRKTIPSDQYSKTDVLNLINAISKADRASLDNLINEVFEFAVSKNIKTLQGKIKGVLDIKTEEVQSGRLKGVKVDSETAKQIKFINNNMLTEESTAEEIEAANEIYRSKIDELSENPVDNVSEIMALTALIGLNNSLLMENTDPSKVDVLDTALENLDALVTKGKSELAALLQAQKDEYNRQLEEAYYEITGEKIDMSDPDVDKILKQASRDIASKENKESVQNKLTKFVKSILGGTRDFFYSAEALQGLMDAISKLPGDLFGGKMQDLVTDKINASSREFKGRRLLYTKVLTDKFIEIYGKNWKSMVRANKIPNTTIESIDMIYSQDQLYYFYNQFKDPANHPAFEKMWGENYKEVAAEIESKLDPKVKQFADWQVDEYFPSLYEHYNEVYKKIYRTDMPWNEFYAGRIYRKDITPEALNLLGQNSINQTSVGGSSTKSRIDNTKEIMAISGTDALMTYLNDMEFFAAYAESVRDINKIFTNPNIKAAIEANHGKALYNLIQDRIEQVANQGSKNAKQTKFINIMNNIFVTTRVALSPVIFLKQMTSTISYAADIGYVNYIKFAVKNKVEMLKVFREIKDNSVYMQDRGATNIMRVIESYSDSAMKEFVPNETKDFFINAMMWFVRTGDKGAIYAGGMPLYSYHKAEFEKKNPQATEQEAIDYAIVKFEDATKTTQQSSDIQDKDYFQTGDAITRGLNAFQTTPKQYLRKEIMAIRNLGRKIKARDIKAGKGSLGENLRQFAMFHLVMPAFFQWVSAGLPGALSDWDDDDDQDMIRAMLIGNLNALFILGEVIEGLGDLSTGKPWAADVGKNVGILELSGSIIKKAMRADKLKDPLKKAQAQKELYAELLTLLRVPAPQLLRMSQNFDKVSSEGMNTGELLLRLLNYSNYAIEGGNKKKKSKSKSKMTKDDKVNLLGIENYNALYNSEFDAEMKALEKEMDELTDFDF